MNTKTMMVIAVLGVLTQAFAAVTVTNVVCRQRYPWNGLVDIDYEIKSDDAEGQYFVYPKGEDRRLGTPIVMHTLSGDGATNAVGVGVHRMIWDAKVDMPAFHTSDFEVKLQVLSQGAQYLVVDLSGGTNAVTYPVRYSTTPPDITTDKCRTTELWLRLVLPGSFMMGSPTTEGGRDSNEQRHPVRLTRPFYIGVFELTQMQWRLISGNTSAIKHVGDCRPVDSVSYNMIRGSSLGAKWPNSDDVDENSFLGILRSRTSLKFDLPTEAQWEYACRAGTTSALNNGGTGEAAMKNVGRFLRNTDDGHESYTEHTKVGMYLPNNWGLYDMHGNVTEWCIDSYQEQLPTHETIDPVGSANLNGKRSWRGGAWNIGSWGTWTCCRSAYRGSDTPATTRTNFSNGEAADRNGNTGFRLVCLPVQ